MTRRILPQRGYGDQPSVVVVLVLVIVVLILVLVVVVVLVVGFFNGTSEIPATCFIRSLLCPSRRR
jgi:hypothetical protein